MPRSRDSIYNVSTDIRLEDYTEDVGKERDYAGREVAVMGRRSAPYKDFFGAMMARS